MTHSNESSNKPLWTLAIETATMVASVALLEDDRVRAEWTYQTRRGHATALLPAIEASMERVGVTMEDLGLVVVPVGPGSFTGIRIGLSTARGIAWSLGIPAVGVSSLETLAVSVGNRSEWVVPVLDARKSELFAAVYRVDWAGVKETLVEPFVAPPEEVARRVQEALGDSPALFVGEGLYVKPEVFENVPRVPRSWDLIRSAVAGQIGRRRFLEEGGAKEEALQAIYLRRSDAEIQVGDPTGEAEIIVLN